MNTINFMGHRKVAMLVSGLLLLASIASLAINQLNWGLDFTGGTLVEVHYSESADLNAVRATLEETNRTLIIDGILMIRDSKSPTLVREMLLAYLPEKHRHEEGEPVPA